MADIIYRWHSSCCNCICNNITKAMVKPCKTHRTYQEAYDHWLRFKGQSSDMQALEKRKPQFQRR